MSSTRYNIKYNREDIENELAAFSREGKIKGSVAMLKGDRGIGKTNLLKEVMAGRDGFIYVSLLGATSIDEIKNKTICSVNKSDSKIINKIMGIKTFGFSLSSVTVPQSYIYEYVINKFLRNKVIIFDDIEISDPKIDIMSLSGFVNELKKKNKVILSLNEEELLQNEEKKEWVIFREKIIDVEYKLNISDEDMVNMVIESHRDWINSLSDENKQNVRKALLSLKTKNVRVGELIFKKLFPILKEINSRFLDGEHKLFEKTIEDTAFVFMLFFETFTAKTKLNDMFESLERYSFVQHSFERSLREDIQKKEKGRNHENSDEYENLSDRLKSRGFNLDNDFLLIIISYLKSGSIFIGSNYQELESALTEIKIKTEEHAVEIINDRRMLKLVNEIRFNPRFDNLELDKSVEELIGLSYFDNSCLVELYKILNAINHKDKNRLLAKITSIDNDIHIRRKKRKEGSSRKNLIWSVRNRFERKRGNYCAIKRNVDYSIEEFNDYSIDELKRELSYSDNLEDFIVFINSIGAIPKFARGSIKFKIIDPSCKDFINTFESLYNKVIKSSRPEDSGLKNVFKLMYENH